MQEVEQRRERLPRVRERGGLAFESPTAILEAKMPLAARRRVTLLCLCKER